MEIIQALLLIILEMLFVTVSLMLLYHQRNIIGKAPFYMTVGLLQLSLHLVAGIGGKLEIMPDFAFDISMISLHLPLLGLFLLVYISEGTLEAQRLVIGVLAVFGAYLYVSEVTRIICNWPGMVLGTGVAANALDLLLSNSRRSMGFFILFQIVELLVTPAVYTALNRDKSPGFFAILGAFLAADILSLPLRFLPPEWSGNLGFSADSTLLARTAGSILIAVLVWLYFRLIERDVKNDARGAFDLIFAFFGGYGRSKELEASLAEWTNRYQLVLENAGEAIIMLSPGGRIIDANIAAEKGMGGGRKLEGERLWSFLRVNQPSLFIPGGVPDKPTAFTGNIRFEDGGERIFYCSISPVQFRRKTLLVLIGRDITEEQKLAEEKAQLAEQLVHSQRIESLGMLAGGIAHDFNNYIHAILGHVDVITYMHEQKPEVQAHLQKVVNIAEQAGKLTSQLLGFARKGKYQVTRLDIAEIVQNCFALLAPQTRKGLELSLDAADSLPGVKGDKIQIQQVLLNLLLNAADAVQDNENERIVKVALRFGTQVDFPLLPFPALGKIDPANYLCISVTDNGTGMPPEVTNRIFEPFFTTKPVGKGTGMGLAMVYGTITNHQGWIQVRSEVGKGTSFHVFLPLFEEEKNENPNG